MNSAMAQELGLGPIWRLRRPTAMQAQALELLVIEPVVVDAGRRVQCERLLDAMLAAIDMRRGEGVRVLACDGQNPAALVEAIKRDNPGSILILGEQALRAVLEDSEAEVAAWRGFVMQHAGAGLVVTHSPGFLLDHPLSKADAWRDLCLLRRSMAQLAA